jgi:15-cis-phytoene synthase
VTAAEDLESSQRFCRTLTRRQAKNFYYGLKLLPPEKRTALFSLYAYMRLADDIADEEDGRTLQQRLDLLEDWRRQTHAVLAGQPPISASPPSPLWPAFAETARKYKLPAFIFDEVIAGQKQDLDKTTFATWEQLYQYCYQVAGVVGLACLHIWGFDPDTGAEAMAVDRGIAFQLTNILRDLSEDAARGRTYLPSDELTALHLTQRDLASGGGGNGSAEAFRRLMRKQIERAESYYVKSAGLEDHISRDSRPTLIAMTAIYRGLLRKVSRRPETVLHRRVSLSLPSKLLIGWRALRAR